MALHPTYKAAYNNLARVYHRKGDDAKALEDADRAVSLPPPDAVALETRGEMHENLNHTAPAVADYRAAIQLDPQNARALEGLKRLETAKQP